MNMFRISDPKKLYDNFLCSNRELILVIRNIKIYIKRKEGFSLKVELGWTLQGQMAEALVGRAAPP